jgi:hypothetical protein
VGFLNAYFQRRAFERIHREMIEYNQMLSAMDADAIALVLIDVHLLRFKIDKKLDTKLMIPYFCIEQRSDIVRTLFDISAIFHKSGQKNLSVANIVWVHTMRAAQDIALLPFGREMWVELIRGAPHTMKAIELMYPVADPELVFDLQCVDYERVPSGMEPRA